MKLIKIIASIHFCVSRFTMVHLFFLCKLTDLENVSFDQKQPSEASLVSKNRDFEKKHVTLTT